MANMRTVVALALVFIASIAIGLLSDPDKAVRSLSHYPALVALAGILWKIVQDEIRDQRTLRRAELLSLNSLFAGSHYASKIYDKQIEFCEHYWALTLEVLKKLYREAATPSVLDDANNLYSYRMEKAIWITDDMNLSLEGFEKALRTLAVQTYRLEYLSVGDERSKVVAEESELFLELLGEERKSLEAGVPVSYTAVLEKLKEVLGISEAHDFRRRVMQNV